MPKDTQNPKSSGNRQSPTPRFAYGVGHPLGVGDAAAALGIVRPCAYHARNMRVVADILYLLAGLLYLPVAVYNAVRLGKNRTGWRERFGNINQRDPKQPRIWLHAVSLGEVNATPRLVETLRAKLPNVDIVVSTTTDTGYDRAVKLFGQGAVFRFPLDFSFVINRAIRRIRPTMIVLVELEVWYNLVTIATRRGIPVVVVNGRFTERSAKRLSRIGWLAKPMFRSLAWVGAQDEPIAARFRQAGVTDDRVTITSSLKWDSAQVVDSVPGEAELAHALGLRQGDRPIWVCGSTGPGEEEMILDACDLLRDQSPDESPTNPLVVLVPRKPERFDEVAKLIEARGHTCIRRSDYPDGTNPKAAVDDQSVILGDTMGELRKFYRLADVVFVGRSLVPMGGSDPIEVAALAKPIVIGPHHENFAMPVHALTQADAVRVVVTPTPTDLAHRIRHILADRQAARDLGDRARQVVRDQQGATGRTADRLVAIMKPHINTTLSV